MTGPLVLFGAFDRHNLGDLLFAHVAQAMQPGRPWLVAGLADRDLRPFGGHAVSSLHRLHREGRLHGATLVHAGGEILTCTARQAAVMLLPPREVDAVLGGLAQASASDEAAWRRATLGTEAEMPYVASTLELPGLRRVVFDAVGGVAVGAIEPAHRALVVDRLARAEAVAVRDATTLAALRAAGLSPDLEPALVPDPVVMVEVLLGDAIRARAASGPVAAIRDRYPSGYVVLQLAAEFTDDATLDLVASQLARVVARAGLGVVCCRAGAAPWHDDPDLPRRLVARLPQGTAQVFPSLQLLDLCALLAQARASAASSLHAGIVATAFGVPALGVAGTTGTDERDKVAAYAATWRAPGETHVARPAQLAGGLDAALGRDRARVAASAAAQVDAYRAHARRLAAAIDGAG